MFKKVFQTAMVPVIATMVVVGCIISTQAMEDQDNAIKEALRVKLRNHMVLRGKEGHSYSDPIWRNEQLIVPESFLPSYCLECSKAYSALKGMEKPRASNAQKRPQHELPKSQNSPLQVEKQELEVKYLLQEERLKESETRLKESEALVSALMAEIEGFNALADKMEGDLSLARNSLNNEKEEKENKISNEKSKTETEVDEELVKTVQNLYNFTGEQIKEERKTKEIITEMMRILRIDTTDVEDQKGSIFAETCLARLKNLEK